MPTPPEKYFFEFHPQSKSGRCRPQMMSRDAYLALLEQASNDLIAHLEQNACTCLRCTVAKDIAQRIVRAKAVCDQYTDKKAVLQ